MLRGYNDKRGQPAPPSPLVIIDLKGDAAFFHAIWEAACQAGRKFRYFSTRPVHSADGFDTDLTQTGPCNAPFVALQGQCFERRRFAASPYLTPIYSHVHHAEVMHS